MDQTAFPMNESKIVFRTERPQYGVDYARGWIGFNHAESNMSAIIAYLEGWERTREIVVSHAFIVSGENECIEAAFPKGVVETPLEEAYFDHDQRYVIFRKPKGLTDEIADRIVDTARKEVGDGFDHGVLANHAAQDNFLGWLINSACSGELKNYADRLIRSDDKWICSELAAYALDKQPEYAGRGVLRNSLGALTPQKLFEDDELFEPLPQ